MDSSITPSVDISKMSSADQQELRQFIGNEMQKAKLQQTVHTLTDLCWRKCVSSPIRSGKLEKAEESCAENCVQRFLDANLAVINHLEKMRHT